MFKARSQQLSAQSQRASAAAAGPLQSGPLTPLGHLIENSPRMAAQREISSMIANSPRQQPRQQAAPSIQLVVQPASALVTSQPIQRFQAQIIAANNDRDAGVIRDVKLSGRTPSPFGGTMGAHSTAWVVHADGVRRQLQGLTMDQAVARMRELFHEAQDSSQLTLDRPKEIFGQAPKLAAALQQAQSLDRSGPGASEVAKTTWLEDFIGAYLNYVNHQPLSTVESGKTGGNAEGVPREMLIAIEGGRQCEPAEVREQFAEMFAVDTPQAYVSDWSRARTEVAPTVAQIWTIALHAFLRATQLAYPVAFVMAQLNERAQLLTFLTALDPAVPPTILSDLSWDGYWGGGPESKPALTMLQGGTGDAVGGNMAVQVRVSDGGLLEAVAMEGRTPSPFVGSMGAHSTAWVAHQDAVRRVVLKQTLPNAIGAVLILSLEAQTSPLLNLIPFILPDQARLLAHSQVELCYFQGAAQAVAQAEGASGLLQKVLLQQLIGAYLQFLNALPLHAAEAADTTGHGEGTHRQNLLSFEEGTLLDIPERKAVKATPVQKGRPFRKKVSQATRLSTAFWGMYDRGSAAAFTDNLFPEPMPLARERIDGRPTRDKRPKVVDDSRQVNENRAKVDARETAYQQKPLSASEKSSLTQLFEGALKVETRDASRSLPQAMALAGFLHTMATAYPKSYVRSWGGLSHEARAALIESKLELEGQEVLVLMAKLPTSGKLVLPRFEGRLERDPSKTITEMQSEHLVAYEQANAHRDGITGRYVIGHASGNWNACLIFSLLYHALGRAATDEEVAAIRADLAHAHADIRNAAQISIYSDTGHAVIRAIEQRHHVSLNVAVVTTRDAPVVPVRAGVTPALLYLMPGHFAPCWRRP